MPKPRTLQFRRHWVDRRLSSSTLDTYGELVRLGVHREERSGCVLEDCQLTCSSMDNKCILEERTLEIPQCDVNATESTHEDSTASVEA